MKIIIAFLVFILLLASTGCRASNKQIQWIQEELEWGLNEIEPGLEKVKADKENLGSKINQFIVTNISVAGQWDSRYWHDGVHLIIIPRLNNEYDVVYYVRGDLGCWALKRKATFHAGILEFDKPVREYMPYTPYKYFYMIQTQKGVRLVSQPLIRDLILVKELETWNKGMFDELMLIKRKPNQKMMAAMYGLIDKGIFVRYYLVPRIIRYLLKIFIVNPLCQET